MSDVSASAGRKDGAYPDRGSAAAGQQASAPRGSFFDIYKSGQGARTRLGTGLAVGALLAWFCYFLYDKLSVVDLGTSTKPVRIGIPLAIFLAVGLFTYWLLARSRGVADFLIATEGEMKKVNWSSRKDIIGSTKVVIFVMVAMAIVLFVIDLFFMGFFSSIGVLKTGGMFTKLFGG